MYRQREDRGQALPLVALQLWLIAGVGILVVMIGTRAVDQSRAQAGADAVALSEALEPGSGRELAGRNSVIIESLRRDTAVEVTAASRSGTAHATAELTRPAWQGLHPALQSALARAERSMGETLIVVSGLRTRAQQEQLWANRNNNPRPVARPGTSLHERGLAVDVAIRQTELLARFGPPNGVCRPLPLSDPVHFTMCQTTPTR
ncbi:MAG: M15 family metallopeptidase [Acidimicrobiales bacterium]